MEISYEKTIYQIQGKRHRLKQKQITVCDLFSKEIVLLFEGEEIAYKRFSESRPCPNPEDEKTLNKRVDQAMERQSRTAHKPAANHPWRIECASLLTKHDFPSERVDKSLISAKADINDLSTLNHTLPTVWRAKQNTIIKPLRGNNNKLV